MAPVTWIAWPDLGRRGFPGDQGRVNGRAPFGDQAIRGDLLARADDELLPRREFADRHPVLRSAAQHGDALDTEGGESGQRGTRAVPRPGLQVAAREHRDGDARGGVEVEGLPARRAERERERHPHAGPACAAEQQRVHRPAERRGDREADQRVHRRRAVAEPGQRGAMQRPGTPAGNRGGKEQADPLPAGELLGRHHRVHDHDHGERDADAQAPAQVADHRVGGVAVVRSRR